MANRFLKDLRPQKEGKKDASYGENEKGGQVREKGVENNLCPTKKKSLPWKGSEERRSRH